MTTTDLPARSTGLSYQELLDTDSRAGARGAARGRPGWSRGPDFVPVAQFTSAEFHRLEVEKLWKQRLADGLP